MEIVAIGGVWVGSIALVVSIFFFIWGVGDAPKLWVGFTFLVISGLGGAVFLFSVPFLPNGNVGVSVLSVAGGITIIVVLSIVYVVANNVNRVDRASRAGFVEAARRRIEF